MSRVIPSALLTHLSGQVLTLATCVKITRLDSVVLGLTSLDRDLTVAGQLYEAMDPVTASSLRATEGQGIDNLDVVGVLNSARISDTDLLAGRYDGAAIELFQVNYQQNPITDRVLLLTGTIGEIRFSEGTYTAEIRSLGQRLAQQIGEVTSPVCRVRQLGDSRCKVGLVAANITAITNAVHGQVTTAAPHGLIVGQNTYFDGVGGMTILNQTVRGVFSTPTSTTFTLTDDTTGYGAYTSGGQIGFQFTRTVASVISPTVLTFSSDLAVTGFFNYGRVQFLTGLNSGIQREIKQHTRISSVTTITLQEAFPFAVGVGESAMLEAGCDRSLLVCQSRYGNVVNLRGEPWLPGNDAWQRRGRH